MIAGIELGGTKCICILGTGPDDIVEEIRIATTTPDETLPAIEAVLDRWRDYLGLGIASFGPMSLDPASPDFGSITATTKPGWSHIGVMRRLAARSTVPVAFDTDVVGAALGEGRWGAAQGLADFAYITVGTGVGVGLIAGGRPVVGMTHGELGHIRTARLEGDDWPGACAFHGACVEGLASGTAIAARTGTAAAHLPADHPAWNAVVDALAQLLHTLVMTGVPRRIIMGGGVITGMPFLLPRLRAALETSLGGYASTPELADLTQYVVPAALGNRAGPLGAIELGARAISAAR